MNFWDQKFSVDGYKYGTAPNAFLAAQVARFPPAADILVPGDGEGRNGTWLAQQGHRVVSMDGSAVGLEKARALADRLGVKIQTIRGDLANWTPVPASADIVALTFVHLPPTIRRDALRRLAAALRPGGCFVLEAFHPRQMGYSSGGPKEEEMLYTLSMLRDDLGDLLTEVEAWEGEVVLDEGPGHQGPAYVTRWVGQRSAAV
ncbi:class I SAM-dependent methyltransferase [Noviherbaspirillum sedimenti]|uniref:Class I SAM-dependent methyltransferase n=1 Tax=Noviherbaspirillum sedimenti TaxID=2320865 RepID=A0A3A3FX65_9BURK|nr:class I SAM-dependent methyltransferase [Noviherbaspirillum sedimenti]RJG00803.1 class I SAM-dependent methyltransferase [Noviherbaspirillum sedimenti]